MAWEGPNFPRPDYLSSSRKRLAPQLLFKGGIINTWGKRQAVALQTAFYDTLPPLPRLSNVEEADMLWLLYDLEDSGNGQLHLKLNDTVFTQSDGAMGQLMKAKPGSLDHFVVTLQRALDAKLTAPDVAVIGQPSEEELDPDNV